MLHLFLGRILWRWLQKLDATRPAEQGLQSTEDGRRTIEHPVPEPVSTGPEWIYPRVQRAAMGSLYEIYLAGKDRETLEGAGEEALNDVERLDRQLSHYKDDS